MSEWGLPARATARARRTARPSVGFRPGRDPRACLAAARVGRGRQAGAGSSVARSQYPGRRDSIESFVRPRASLQTPAGTVSSPPVRWKSLGEFPRPGISRRFSEESRAPPPPGTIDATRSGAPQSGEQLATRSSAPDRRPLTTRPGSVSIPDTNALTLRPVISSTEARKSFSLACWKNIRDLPQPLVLADFGHLSLRRRQRLLQGAQQGVAARPIRTDPGRATAEDLLVDPHHLVAEFLKNTPRLAGRLTVGLGGLGDLVAVHCLASHCPSETEAAREEEER